MTINMQIAYNNILVKNLTERDHLRDLGVDERIMLKWSLK
jgi:hypothetical protein